jgi:hypothetical protein
MLTHIILPPNIPSREWFDELLDKSLMSLVRFATTLMRCSSAHMAAHARKTVARSVV